MKEYTRPSIDVIELKMEAFTLKASDPNDLETSDFTGEVDQL